MIIINKYFCRARRVDAPPRQSFSPNFQLQQQSFNLAGNLQQPLFGQTKKVATSNNNNFQDSRSEPLGGEITPNCVCRCTCCPCCPCTPGEEDYLQYIDWKYTNILNVACTYGIDSIKVSILCTTYMIMKPELKKVFIFSGRMENFVTKAAGFIGWQNFVVYSWFN